jgi:hypothetical protein
MENIEKIVRKKWLNAFIIYVIFIPFSYAITFATAVYIDILNNKIPQLSNLILDITFIYFIFVLIFWLHYHCGYKKRGTHLLGWISIMGGLKFISQIPNTCKDIQNNFIEYGISNLLINFFHIVAVLEIVTLSYYLLQCWKLYQSNHAYKKTILEK